MPLGSVPHCHQQVLSSWIQLWAGSSKTRNVINSTFTGLGQSEDVLKQQCQHRRSGAGRPHTPLPPPPSSVSCRQAVVQREQEGQGETPCAICSGITYSQLPTDTIQSSLLSTICNMRMPGMYEAQKRSEDPRASAHPHEGSFLMAGNKPVSRYAQAGATGEGTLRGKTVGRKRLSKGRTKGTERYPTSF